MIGLLKLDSINREFTFYIMNSFWNSYSVDLSMMISECDTILKFLQILYLLWSFRNSLVIENGIRDFYVWSLMQILVYVKL